MQMVFAFLIHLYIFCLAGSGPVTRCKYMLKASLIDGTKIVAGSMQVTTGLITQASCQKLCFQSIWSITSLSKVAMPMAFGSVKYAYITLLQYSYVCIYSVKSECQGYSWTDSNTMPPYELRKSLCMLYYAVNTTAPLPLANSGTSTFYAWMCT
jgi:hypothetical protein